MASVLNGGPSLPRRYRASAVLRTSPPPHDARCVPRGLPVGSCSDHALGLPVLRTLSLCTCCRHCPGAASGRIISLGNPAVSAFPERVVGSACASSFSRFAQRSLSLRPAHSRCHQFVTRIPKASASSLPPWLLRLLPAGAVAGWALHPLENSALSRRTPKAVIWHDKSWIRRNLYSITSSAIASKSRGTMSPSVRAVFKLIISFKLAGRRTSRSV